MASVHRVGGHQTLRAGTQISSNSATTDVMEARAVRHFVGAVARRAVGRDVTPRQVAPYSATLAVRLLARSSRSASCLPSAEPCSRPGVGRRLPGAAVRLTESHTRRGALWLRGVSRVSRELRGGDER